MSKRQRDRQLPEGWERLGGRGFGPFTTTEVLRRPDGRTVVWESRRARKQRPHPRGTTWWAPGALGWWVGVLFAFGSVAFGAGSFPPFADAVGTTADSVAFFIGSLFFTTAAFLLYCETAWTDPPRQASRGGRARALLRPRPGRIDWLATVIQLAGTVYFNVSTAHAMTVTGSPAQVNQAVWRPDVFGSLCFLVSSWLSWAEVCHGVWAWQPRSLGWRIALVNLAGSVAFGVSAVASRVESTGSLRNLVLTNLGTFIGAACFLAGALWLLPERNQPRDAGPSEHTAGGALGPEAGGG